MTIEQPSPREQRMARATAGPALDALKKPAVQKRLALIGAEPIGSTPAALREHLAKETDKWGALIRERGIRAD